MKMSSGDSTEKDEHREKSQEDKSPTISNESSSKIKATNKNDIDERFLDDPGKHYRMYSVISYFIVLVVIGIPVWWYTTRVYRADLPIDIMINLNVPSKTIRENSIPLALDYDVLLTIINPDPHNLKVHLDGRIINKNLQPFLNLIDGIATYTTKSQWVYMTDLSVNVKKENDTLVINENQLTHIITPLEKKIWSHMSSRPTINMVLYIPHCERTLKIVTTEKILVESNAFISPGWGGIYILNSDKQSCDEKSFSPKLEPIIQTFMAQLEKIVGLKGTSVSDVDQLKYTKAKEMIDSSKRTLKSLALLLSEISSIVISDEVAHQIIMSLEKAFLAERYLEKNKIDDALRQAQIAFKNAEAAFSDPSLLALLYFPDDQKYAVYIPLFLPIMIPVCMSLLKLLKQLRNK